MQNSQFRTLQPSGLRNSTRIQKRQILVEKHFLLFVKSMAGKFRTLTVLVKLRNETRFAIETVTCTNFEIIHNVPFRKKTDTRFVQNCVRIVGLIPKG